MTRTRCSSTPSADILVKPLGSTMISALHALRAQKPARLICAVPVSPPDTLAKVRHYADEVVCLQTPLMFQAVGQFYADFPQVEDSEVEAILKQA